MRYNTNVVIAAQKRLEQMKIQKQHNDRVHLRLAYEKIPELRNIDFQLRQSVPNALRAAMAGGENPTEAVARVQKENTALQQRRRQLIAEQLEPDFLNDGPLCAKCGDAGYIGTQMCTCLQELCRLEQEKVISLLSDDRERFENFRLDYYDEKIDSRYGVSPRKLMERNLELCRRYAKGGCMGNLLFNGGTGLGKTFLSACIAREAAGAGLSVEYIPAGKLFRISERAHFQGDEDSLVQTENYEKCDLLILDDLGTELPGTFVSSALYMLLNQRLLDNKSTVISTNMTVDELKERYTPQIASRLQGSYTLLTFIGEDIRVRRRTER